MSTPRKSIPLTLAALVGFVAIAVAVLGVLPALQRRHAVAAEAEQRSESAPRVVFVEAVSAPPSATVTLPARLLARQHTELYAQVGGYLGSMHADLGDAVTAGQLLVEIDTPLLDQQIQQNASSRQVAEARIDLAQAKLDLSKASLARLRSVGDARAISQQALDEAAATQRSDDASLAAARADLAAVEADGRRLAALKSLARIVAPFDGEVTRRSFDQGALVVADRSEGSTPIFGITNRSHVRAFVDVPQSLASSIAIGQPMTIRVRELPRRAFEAQVVRAAPSLDDVTRTRLVEASIPNDDRALLPGMFAEATLTIARPSTSVLVPGEAIIVRQGRPTAAIIGDDGTLRYAEVTLGRDTGMQVEVLEGVPVGARVAVNLSRQHPDGSRVEPVKRAVAPAPPTR
jgi:membrane fusion protein, multidrug efflux system